MLVLVLLLGFVFCVVLPFATYRGSLERGKRLWPQAIVRTYVVPDGAYRSAVVRDETEILAPPRIVRVVGAMSAFLGMAWIPSAPCVLLGLAEESSQGLGPALLFGVPGCLLSIAIFATGPRLLKRKNARAARIVAWWSLTHNLVLLLVVVFATLAFGPEHNDPLGMRQVESWEMYAANGFGAVALLYICVSLGHAIAMLDATHLVERATA